MQVVISNKTAFLPEKPTNQKLYHGTSARVVPKILTEGLLPRETTGEDNFGSSGLGSLPGFVYLGSKEFIFYSIVAALRMDAQYRLAVVEVDLDVICFDNLYPNEDAIWSSLLQDGCPDLQGLQPREGIAECAESVEANQHLWYRLLMDQCSVAHKGAVPLSAITRISVFDFNLIMHDLFYHRQCRGGGTLIEPLSDGSYDILRRWMFGRGMTPGGLRALRADASARGYSPYPNESQWHEEYEKMRRRPPTVFRPMQRGKADLQVANKLSLPIRRFEYPIEAYHAVQ